MVLAIAIALTALLCLERVKVGYVGVVYSARGVEEQTLSQGWHFLSPMKHVKQFPVSQQQIAFSNNPGDYNDEKHADWHIDAPADSGMVTMNLTVNCNFLPDKVVSLYTRFNGMDGETIVESRFYTSCAAEQFCKPVGGIVNSGSSAQCFDGPSHIAHFAHSVHLFERSDVVFALSTTHWR